MLDDAITVSLRDASRLTGLSSNTLRRMCIQNTIKHCRLKNGASNKTTYLIFRESLGEFLVPYDPRPPKIHVPSKRRPGRPESIVI